jgi:hypothetical protein
MDLLLIAEEPPEFSLPANVIFIKKTLQELNTVFSRVVLENLSIDIAALSLRGTARETGWQICHYKPFFGEAFKEHLSEYSHWAFGDCDLIFGSLSSAMPDILEYDLVIGKGHFGVIKNSSKYLDILLAKDAWLRHRKYAIDQLNKIKIKYTDLSVCGNGPDEMWLCPLMGIYAEHHKDVKYVNIQKEGMYCHIRPYMNAEEEATAFRVDCCNVEDIPHTAFLYEDDQLYRTVDAKGIKCPYMYAHFIRRTTKAINPIVVINYDEPLQYTITPPLTFKKLV